MAFFNSSASLAHQSFVPPTLRVTATMGRAASGGGAGPWRRFEGGGARGLAGISARSSSAICVARISCVEPSCKRQVHLRVDSSWCSTVPTVMTSPRTCLKRAPLRMRIPPRAGASTCTATMAPPLRTNCTASRGSLEEAPRCHPPYKSKTRRAVALHGPAALPAYSASARCSSAAAPIPPRSRARGVASAAEIASLTFSRITTPVLVLTFSIFRT
mmetsp:Transcript_5684/g.17998  ORF Transcript_5684/g.17998 Transcript_5684/m.17998 type:complete len:216 (-) Transcript_5684:757-1404(-)